MKYENLFSNIKMGKEILTFGDIEIKKFENFTAMKVYFFQKMQILKTYQYLTRFFLVKKKYKYFIDYLYDDYKIKPN